MNNMQLLNRKQVANRTNLSVSTIKRLEREGRFPQRIQVTQIRVAWLQSEVDDWIGQRVAARDHVAA